MTLISHAGALGDLITTLPAIRVWRALHPGERVLLLCKPAFAPLCSPQDAGDAVWDIESAAAAQLFSAHGIDPGSAAAQRLRGVDSALLFASASSPLLLNLRMAGVSKILCQAPFPPTPMHAVDWHLSLFADRLFDAGERIPRLECLEGPRPEPSGRVVMAPGSGSERKNWPLSRFVRLSDSLRAAGHPVAWVLGPAERRIAAPDGVRELRCPPLADLARTLAGCLLFVGNDSGVTHLAAASGCLTVALFGESDPRVWSPRGARVALLDAAEGGIASLSFDRVEDACIAVLEGSTESLRREMPNPCGSPCIGRWIRRTGGKAEPLSAPVREEEENPTSS